MNPLRIPLVAPHSPSKESSDQVLFPQSFCHLLPQGLLSERDLAAEHLSAKYIFNILGKG